MKFDRDTLIIAMLTVFMSMWVYTEISEYITRDLFTAEVNEFMHKGDRFTNEDGDALSERIDVLEKKHE